jgi:hypothetical protein
MNALSPPEFLRTVYVGDRACKAICLESWQRQVVIKVDLLSRIRSPSGEWQYYSAEDIPDGRIVFTGVEAVRFEPAGPLPNDLINEISAKPAGANGASERWAFEVSIGSIAPDGSTTEVVMWLVGTGLHLEDPRQPGVPIHE